MTDIKTLKSSDYFFYYDNFSIDETNEHELMTLMEQPKRSLFYSRVSGVGIHDSENYPNSLALLVGLKYDIVNSVATRNTRVVDGAQNSVDRRMALGQETIKVEQRGGEIDLTVWYVNIYNYEQVNNINLPIGSR